MTILLAGARRRSVSVGVWPLPAVGTLTVQPTYDGSGLTIHPSVLDMGTSFNGYRWWMADTPFPGWDDNYENPSIWASNDRINWTVPEGHTNPLVPDPGGSLFNFDTELIWDTESELMICYWRFNGALWAATSPDGHAWAVLQTPVVASMNGASPSIVQEDDGSWRMWLMRPADGADLRIWSASTPLGTWTHDGPADIALAANHGDIIRHQGVYMGVIYATGALGVARPIASTDGMTWVHGDAIPGMDVYRTTLLPSTEPGMLDVWYSTYVTQRVTYTRLPVPLFLDLLS